MKDAALAEALDWYIANGARLRQIVHHETVYDVFASLYIRGIIWIVATLEGDKKPLLLKIKNRDAYELMNQFHQEDKEDGL